MCICTVRNRWIMVVRLLRICTTTILVTMEWLSLAVLVKAQAFVHRA